MVQRKTCQETKPYNLQQETRFFGQEHLKILGPEMMMMKKRTKPKRKLKEHTVSQSGKTQTPPRTHDDLVVRSPNYMKGTTSSEARKEKNKKRSFDQKNQTSPKHVSCYGVNKERSNNKPSSRIVKGLRKAMSFKRCSQRATCSSTLKNSKFPKYLMLNHGGSDDDNVNGTSVLKVCPYKYCSLNGHLHAQCPTLKSFISSRRQSLKSQKSVKIEDFVEMMCVDAKKEYEHGTFDTQISVTLSEGSPCSETDTDDYSDSVEMVTVSEGDHVIIESEMVKISEDDHGVDSKESYAEEILVDDFVKETCEVDAVSQISETITEEEPCSETESDDYSDSVEMVTVSEGDHVIIESIESFVEEKSNKDGDTDQSCCFTSEDIGMMKNSEVDDTNEETLEHIAEDFKEESQDNIEVVSMVHEITKVPYNQTRRTLNQEEDSEATISWTIFGRKKQVVETDDSKEFNPREPSYLPLVADPDSEKVDLKHQDMDERRNSEDWMFDYALQRVVTKLSSARKRKVALLVEAFETVQPIEPHGNEPGHVLSCGRHLQACN